jgi:hypothetical protein
MNKNIDLLKDYIFDYWSFKKDKIFEKTTLDDMGMFGNDKYDFLVDFSKKFNVDISNIKFELYVEPEPSLIMHLDSFMRFFFKRKLTQKYDVKDISIEMLVNSMEKGKWIGNN